uniref:Uncharacterized protein n=1 Tax=Tetranychus urticae TaxID=32264 RepID=T1KTD8_TETUR
MFKVHRVPTKRVLNCSRKSKYIYNQRTLLGVLVGLMANQKVAICVARILDSDGNLKIIPFGFKMNEESIPADLIPLSIHANNLVNLEIEGAKPILVMIVCVGDDSQEVKLSYSMFLDKIKEKISSYETKISRWLTSNKILVTKSDSKSLIPIDEEIFEGFIRRIEIINRREKAKPTPSKLFPQVASTLVDLSNDSSTTQSDSSDYEDSDHQKKPSKPTGDEPSTSKGITQKNQKTTVNVLEFLIKINESFQNIEFYQSFTSENDGLRFIPEIDETRQENSGLTFVEGVLPLKTKNYQLAMKMKPATNSEIDSGAACILSNLIRFAFPSHWIENVTLRGSGGRTSLLNIWNHVDPLKLPLKEPKDVLLGESRFRALLDHVVRKSGRKSYDKAVERILVSTLSKAMHYARSKLVNTVKKSSKSESFFDQKDEKSNDYFQNPVDSIPNPYGPKPKVRAVQQHKDIFDFMDDTFGENVDDDESIKQPRKSKNQRIDDNDASSQESVGKEKSGAKIDESDKTQDSKSQSTSGLQDQVATSPRILRDKNTSMEEVETESSGFIEPSHISSDGHLEFVPNTNSTPLKSGISERELNSKRPLEMIGESPVKKSKQDSQENVAENLSVKASTSSGGFSCSFKINPVFGDYGNEIPSSQPVDAKFFQSLVKTPTKTPITTPTKTPVNSPVKTPIKTPVNSPVKTPIKSPIKTPIKSPSIKKGQSAEEKYARACELLKKNNLLDKFFAAADVIRHDNSNLTSSDYFDGKRKCFSQPRNQQQLKIFSVSANRGKSTKKSKPSNPAETNENVSKSQPFPTKRNSIASVLKKVDKRQAENLKDLYAIILPLLLDESKKNWNQPVLVTIDQQNLIEIGIPMDFDFLEDEEVNLFTTNINNTEISFKIIALGGDLNELRDSLKKNIETDSNLKNLRKVINSERKIAFEQDDDRKNQCGTIVESLAEDSERENSVDRDSNKRIQTNTLSRKQREQSHDNNHEIGTIKKNIPENEDEDNPDSSEKRKAFLSRIQDKVLELKKKKVLLSEIDSTGNILRSVIDTVDEIFNFVCDKYKESQMNLHEIQAKDSTYKEKAKNKVYIEGKLQLPLDLYETALKFSKPGNPYSLAYQLVKSAFPKSYYENITLGKKHYTHEELNSFKNKKLTDFFEEKIPLAFALGFQDPMEKPYCGEFNPNLGQKRVNAFFDHVFRKSGMKKYSEDELNKVRARIIRILCCMNKKNNDQESKDQESDEQNDSDSNLTNSNILDSRISSRVLFLGILTGFEDHHSRITGLFEFQL